MSGLGVVRLPCYASGGGGLVSRSWAWWVVFLAVGGVYPVQRRDPPQGKIHVKGVPCVTAVHQFMARWLIHSIQASMSLPMHGPWGLAKTLFSGTDMGWDSGNMAAGATVTAS